MSTIIKDLQLAVETLQKGALVAIPTETVYGLAAAITQPQAIAEIFELKNRPLNHPLIMHIAEKETLSKWVEEIPPYTQRLIDACWPGPLTLVFKVKNNQVNPLITGRQTSVAIRCPKHSLTQALLNELKVPIVAPSANPFGKISPTTAEHVRDSFKDKPLLILDGGRCPGGIESTIIALTHEGYQILRPGLISAAQLQQVLPDIPLRADLLMRSPGRLAQHYQPEKPLYCFTQFSSLHTFLQQSAKLAYLMTFTKDLNFPHQSHLYYPLPQEPAALAYELYFQLRRADHSPADIILLELPPATEPWLAIRERLLKAGKMIA